MQFDVDLTTHTPIYLQVMSQVKHAIATDELRPGDQLPTLRRLADELDVNFNTVARAYRQLDEEGIISTQHGRGTYLLGPATKKGGDKLRQKDLEALIEQVLREAQKLGFSLSEIQARIKEHINTLKQQE